MRDATKIDFKVMNDDLRIELIMCVVGEAIDTDAEDHYVQALLRKLLAVPNGEPIGGYWAEDDEEDMTPNARVALMIDYYFGNL